MLANHKNPLGYIRCQSCRVKICKTFKDIVNSSILNMLIKNEVVVEYALNFLYFKVQNLKPPQSPFPLPHLPDVHKALVKKGEHMSEISTIKRTNSLPYVLLACLGILWAKNKARREREAVSSVIPCWVQGKGSHSFEYRENNRGTFHRQTRKRIRWVRRNWGWD